MTGFDSEANRREAIRKQIVDAAYDNAMRVILSHGATHTMEERTYLQAMLIERLAKGLCMEAMSQVFRQEIQDAEGRLTP